MSDPPPCWLQRREAGVLLHPTSLAGATPQGTLGAPARHCIDVLAAAGFRVWQMLPIHPVHADRSPYLPRSCRAGHTGLLSAEELAEDGLLDRDRAAPADFDLPEQRGLVQRAWQCFSRDADAGQRREFERFRREQADWLYDYALFRVLADGHHQRPWYQWPLPLRRRAPEALAQAGAQWRDDIDRECFGQFLFERQWQRLRRHAHSRGMQLFGDLPIYAATDSADVWQHRELFTVDDAGHLRACAGVPPDAFAASGQRWGNPLYRWERVAARGYDWWIARFRRLFELFDLIRIDHFRGFEAYWAIPGDADSAASGSWHPGPGAALFRAVFDALGPLQLVAEDLGDITAAVEHLRRAIGAPGMRVLQFGFEGEPDNPHRPENHTADSVVYTGTHDNDTTLGWWRSLPQERQQAIAGQLNGADINMPERLIHAALASPAHLAILPMQDLLGLGSEARMNTPGTTSGNWLWRMHEGDLEHLRADHLRASLQHHGRLPGT